MSGTRRRAAPVAVVGATILLMAGCSPAYEGVAGVTVDERGAPVVLVHPCSGVVTQVVTVFGRRDGGPTEQSRAVAWDAPRGTTVPFRFSPWGEHEGWTLGQAMGETGVVRPPPLDEGYVYDVHGSESGWTGVTYTQRVSFAVADLRALRPGDVRFSGWDGDGTVHVAPEKQFLESTCRS